MGFTNGTQSVMMIKSLEMEEFDMNLFDFKFDQISKEEQEMYVLEMKQIRSELEAHIIPNSYPNLISNFNITMISVFHPEIVREEIIKISSYSLISKDWIMELKPLLQGKRCLEIMSGLGMLAKALQEEGIEVIATDSKEWNYDEQYWTEVKTLDALSAIELYGTDVDFIICSWIPYQSDIGTKILLKMKEINPQLKMIYIGEFGGCCADDEFFEMCDVEPNEYIINANKKFKSWAGIHDSIYLLK